jgi:hypothetical protein
MSWRIYWNDGTASTWPVSAWPIGQVLALRNIWSIALTDESTGRWQSIL